RGEAWGVDRGVGRDPPVRRSEAIAAFPPPAVALRVEARGEALADGEAVGRHPVIGEGKRLGGAGAGGAVDAGLERVALSAAQPLRQGPVGAAAGKRDADDAGWPE